MIRLGGLASWHGFFPSCGKTGTVAIAGSREAKQLLQNRETLIFSASRRQRSPKALRRAVPCFSSPAGTSPGPSCSGATHFLTGHCVLVGSAPAGAISILFVC